MDTIKIHYLIRKIFFHKNLTRMKKDNVHCLFITAQIHHPIILFDCKVPVIH